MAELVQQLLQEEDVPESFTEALHDKLATTRSLVTKIAQASDRMTGSSQQRTVEQEQKLQTEVRDTASYEMFTLSPYH